MSRSRPSDHAEDAATARRPGRERRILIALFVVQALLRAAFTLHHDVDSDEPQHLHVAWHVARGDVQYRDVFDNHAPLFHALSAPLVRAIGERADILILLRVALLPLVFVILWATWRIAGRLHGASSAWWAVALAGLWPDFILTSSEYRTDVLWTAFWLLAVMVLVCGRLTRARCAVTGLLLGAALCVSMKSTLLLLALGSAATILVLLRWARGSRWPFRWMAVRGAVILPGLLLPLLGIAGYFSLRGAGRVFLYCTITHNMVPGLGTWHKYPNRPWLFLLALPLVWWLGRSLLDHAPSPGTGARRALVGLTAAVYLAALYCFWPLITREDFLPFEPLAAVVMAPALLAMSRRGLGAPGPLARARRVAPVLLAALEITLVVLKEPPWQDHTQLQTRLLADVLRLTEPGNYVMDLKGETVFRVRPFYFALEGVTKTRIAAGLIQDSVAQCLVKTRTCVAVEDSRFFPDSARAYMNAHYVSVGRLRVLGHVFAGSGRTPAPPDTFALSFPERFAVIANHGRGDGTLDGRRYVGPVRLGAGRHSYQPGPGEDTVAVIWAQAAERNFTPFASTATP